MENLEKINRVQLLVSMVECHQKLLRYPSDHSRGLWIVAEWNEILLGVWGRFEICLHNFYFAYTIFVEANCGGPQNCGGKLWSLKKLVKSIKWSARASTEMIIKPYGRTAGVESWEGDSREGFKKMKYFVVAHLKDCIGTWARPNDFFVSKQGFASLAADQMSQPLGERQLWRQFSKLWIFHWPGSIPQLQN